MTTYSKGFDIASVDDGKTMTELSSIEEEPKTANKFKFTDIETNPIVLDVYLEREKIVDSLPLESKTDVNPPLEVLLDMAIPVGQKIKAVITPQSSGSQGTAVGWVEYEITS